jgi:hypothetical protein
LDDSFSNQGVQSRAGQVGRLGAGEFEKLNVGIIITSVVLVGFYLGGWDI